MRYNNLQFCKLPWEQFTGSRANIEGRGDSCGLSLSIHALSGRNASPITYRSRTKNHREKKPTECSLDSLVGGGNWVDVILYILDVFVLCYVDTSHISCLWHGGGFSSQKRIAWWAVGNGKTLNQTIFSHNTEKKECFQDIDSRQTMEIAIGMGVGARFFMTISSWVVFYVIALVKIRKGLVWLKCQRPRFSRRAHLKPIS